MKSTVMASQYHYQYKNDNVETCDEEDDRDQYRVSSVDGSETETVTDDSSLSGQQSTSKSSDAITKSSFNVTDYERLQIETFFRGLKTQVFVCGSLANLYSGSTSHNGWEFDSTGIPVIILDSGETRSRSKRRIQILLAERGTCFTLWSDTIDNLTSYRSEMGQAFHTMHLSSDHTSLIGLSFDSIEAADEMYHHVEVLTANPANISLSMAGKKSRKVKVKQPSVAPLPAKDEISQPCCFQHITSIELGDRTRYRSLQTLMKDRGSIHTVTQDRARLTQS